MFQADHQTIVCDVPRPHVARITLNREKQMNAYNWRMTQELQAAIAAYRDDDELRALIPVSYTHLTLPTILLV